MQRPPVILQRPFGTCVVRQEMTIPECWCGARMVRFAFESGDPYVRFSCAEGHEQTEIGPEASFVERER